MVGRGSRWDHSGVLGIGQRDGDGGFVLWFALAHPTATAGACGWALNGEDPYSLKLSAVNSSPLRTRLKTATPSI